MPNDRFGLTTANFVGFLTGRAVFLVTDLLSLAVMRVTFVLSWLFATSFQLSQLNKSACLQTVNSNYIAPLLDCQRGLIQ